MSSGIPLDQKEQIRQASDIVDLVGSYLDVVREGSAYAAVCPWHDDHSPSLKINPERQTWRCFVCDDGGDVFSFVQKREGVGFREALELLADRAGIQIYRGPRPEPGSPNDRSTLFQAMDWAEQQFHLYLLEAASAASARDYLSERGVSDQTIRDLRIGFVPNEWQWLRDRASGTSFSLDVLDAVGMVSTNERNRKYDRFRGRVMFPIHDLQGRTIAFGGRILPELAQPSEQQRPPAKYINSPETRLFKKHEHLYGLDQARDAVAKKKRVLVMEGYTDVAIAHQCGFPESVAVLGTALGEAHIKLLKRFLIPRASTPDEAGQIYLILDGDAAGQRRTNEVLTLFLREQADVRILTLPSGFDPADFLLAEGAGPFEDLLADAVDALEHKLRIGTTGIDLIHDTHRANQALEDVLELMAAAPSGSLNRQSTGMQLRIQQMLARLTRLFRVDESTLRQRFKELQQRQRRQSRPPGAENNQPHESTMSAWEQEILDLLLTNPQLVVTIIESITPYRVDHAGLSQVLQACRELLADDIRVDFDRLMLKLDDSRLKSMLVRASERATEKQERALATPEVRLQMSLQKLEHDESQRRNEAVIANLEEQHYDDEEAINQLHQLLRNQRKRQGISDPTDG